MTLEPGARIGPYEVRGALGAGGMGEVFRARDTALGRDVAIKILPAAFAADDDRLARFEREAQALASLSHPNIAQVYAIEPLPDGRAIVMELVEGEDLSDLIARGPMPIDDALAIARQIARALEAAHDAGIVHRDLKPANVKVKADGTAKVLDFGLAKAIGGGTGASPSSLPNSPTLTARATELGVVLGTAAYMSPEQAKGRAVDRRADVWAFGVVLYEMLTGRRAFAGDDVTEVMAAVLRDTPDVAKLPPATPAGVRRVLRRCLEKDARKRVRDMADVGLELDEAIAAPAIESASAAAMPTATTARRLPLAIVATAAVALAGLASLVTWWLTPLPTVDRPITRFTVPLDDGQRFTSLVMPSIVLSPDGRRLAYRADGVIFVRALDELRPREVVRSPGSGLVFSPKGDSILFGTTQGLSKVALAGGPAQQVVDVKDLSGFSWDANDSIVYGSMSAIHRVPATGGTPDLLVSAPEGGAVGWPQLLPDERTLLYTAVAGSGSQQAVSLMIKPSNSEARSILQNAGGARYVSTGHLVFGENDRLLAVPFDVNRLETIGTAVPMPEVVYVSGQSLIAHASVAADGTLAYVSTERSLGTLQLAWVDAQGKSSPAFTTARNYSDVELSPEGRRAAVHLWDQDNDIWVADLDRGSMSRVTFSPTEDETPVWSPDGREVAYASSRNAARRELLRKVADGSAAAAEKVVWGASEHFHVNDWSKDGMILVEIRRQKTLNDIVAIDAATGAARDLLASPYSETQARLSPDGKWLAYVSDESGRNEVYVQPYPALDARVPVSTAGGVEPVWSRDSRKLFYRTADSVMVAELRTSSRPEFASPKVMFADKFTRTQGLNHTHYDVGPDGRFLMIEPPAGAQAGGRQEIQIVINWAETLKRLVPVRK